MTIWRLALRNILRQRRRTFLSLLVVAAGFMALALAGGFMAQSFRGLADGAIRGGIGHLQFLHPEALVGDEDQTLALSLADGEGLATRLRQDPAVQEALPRIQFMGLASSGPKSVAFLGTAVDPAREAAHMGVLDQVKDGAKAKGGAGSRWLDARPGSREVVLGIGLARSLGLQVGDGATLMSTTREGALNAVDVEVVGLLDLGLKELNDRVLDVSLETGEALVSAGSARSRVSVVLKDPSQVERELPRLQKLAEASAVARPWTELATFYKQVKMLYYAIFGFMGLVLFLVVLLATANTLFMSVMERIREFGVLRAVGLPPGRLVALVQAEGALLGLGGSALGLTATLLVRGTLNALHLEMPAPPGVSHGYELNIHFVPLVYLLAFLGIQATIQAAALLPGIKAARLKVVEALRHV